MGATGRDYAVVLRARLGQAPQATELRWVTRRFCTRQRMRFEREVLCATLQHAILFRLKRRRGVEIIKTRRVPAQPNMGVDQRID